MYPWKYFEGQLFYHLLPLLRTQVVYYKTAQWGFHIKHRKNCECCPCHPLFKGKLWMLRLLFSIVRNVISVSQVTSLLDWSLRVFSNFNCHCHCLFWKCHDSSSVWSNVSGYKSMGKVLWGCLLNVFDIFFFLDRWCLLITLIKCPKGHRSLWSLFQDLI